MACRRATGIEISTFYDDLQKRFSAIPGVGKATLSNAPLIGGETGFPVKVPGEPPDPEGRTRVMAVGPGYFRTMQIPLLAGRAIEERDRPGAPLAVVVSELLRSAPFCGPKCGGATLVDGAER